MVSILRRHSVLIFGLSTFSLFFLFMNLLSTELYGSAFPCDPSNLTNCDEKKPSSSTTAGDDTQSDNTRTPLVLPDVSPTGSQ